MGSVLFIGIIIIVVIYCIRKSRKKKALTLLPEGEKNYPVAPPIQLNAKNTPDNTPIYRKNGLPIEEDYPSPPNED